MNQIDLDLDLNNELEFKIAVEGTKPAQASCRLVFENSNFDISFPGKIQGSDRAIVSVPPLEHIIEEGIKKATLEMIVDDRIFKPLELSVNFKKSIKVFAETVTRDESFQKPKASAVLVTKSQPKEKIVENSPTTSKAQTIDTILKDMKPDWPVEIDSDRSDKTQKIIESKLSNLTEDDLRDKIRTLLLSKRK